MNARGILPISSFSDNSNAVWKRERRSRETSQESESRLRMDWERKKEKRENELHNQDIGGDGYRIKHAAMSRCVETPIINQINF